MLYVSISDLLSSLGNLIPPQPTVNALCLLQVSSFVRRLPALHHCNDKGSSLVPFPYLSLFRSLSNFVYIILLSNSECLFLFCHFSFSPHLPPSILSPLCCFFSSSCYVAFPLCLFASSFAVLLSLVSISLSHSLSHFLLFSVCSTLALSIIRLGVRAFFFSLLFFG